MPTNNYFQNGGGIGTTNEQRLIEDLDLLLGVVRLLSLYHRRSENNYSLAWYYPIIKLGGNSYLSCISCSIILISSMASLYICWPSKALDGQQIYNEAIEEIRMIEQEMQLKYELPPSFMIG